MRKIIQFIFAWAVIQTSAPAQDLGQMGTAASTGTQRMVDPYRIINNYTNAITAGWVMFSGTVIEVQPKGVRIEGYYSTIPTGLGAAFTGDFFVLNFPYKVAPGDTIGTGKGSYYAKPSGAYTYPTVFGKSQTIHQLNYGKVWTPPPPTPEQLARARANAMIAQTAAERKTQAALARALKANLDQAAAGDSYGQLRMGERYSDGDGVPKDLAKAREYFLKSAAQGNATATAELDALPAQK